MSNINNRVVCHQLTIDPTLKLVSYRKCKVGEEKKEILYEEVKKLTTVCFIMKVNYPSWLDNILVKKASNNYRICIDFPDLNSACPKDLYPLPNIDCLVERSSSYKTLSFTDAYSGYNKIKMDCNTPKILLEFYWNFWHALRFIMLLFRVLIK